MASGNRLPHYVTVEDGRIVKFECGWLYGACHFYPDCDCETWNSDHLLVYGPGHERTHREDCWMKDWFEAPAVYYTGEDFNDCTDDGIPEGMNRSGRIQYEFLDDGLEWWFV